MQTYCKNCSTNWLYLATQESGEEVYEFCPKCRTDFYLEDTKPGDTYRMNFSGEIINTTTGQKVPASFPPSARKPRLVKEYTPYTQEQWEAYREGIEAREDAYLAKHGVSMARYDQEVKAVIIESI